MYTIVLRLLLPAAIAVSLAAQTPVAGVKITTSDGRVAYTDAQGYYSITVPYGWTGTITPSAAGYTFTPASVSLENLLADMIANVTASLVPSPPPSGEPAPGNTGGHPRGGRPASPGTRR